MAHIEIYAKASPEYVVGELETYLSQSVLTHSRYNGDHDTSFLPLRRGFLSKKNEYRYGVECAYCGYIGLLRIITGNKIWEVEFRPETENVNDDQTFHIGGLVAAMASMNHK